MPILKRELERFLNDVRIALPGSSDNGIKQALFNVLDDFCENSSAWQETLTVPILAGTTQGNVNTNCNYTLMPQENGYIIGLVGTWDPNLIPQPAFMPNFNGGPGAIGQLVLVNPVNQNQNFTVTVYKTVLATEVDRDNVPLFSETLFRRYRRYIEFGVMGFMQGEANKPYSNDAKAQANQQRFRAGVSIARQQNERQNTRGAQSWSFPQTFRTRGQRGGVSTANPTTF